MASPQARSRRSHTLTNASPSLSSTASILKRASTFNQYSIICTGAMFPLHPGDELCFNISPTPHKQHDIPQDLILPRAALPVTDKTNNMRKSRRRKFISVDNDEPAGDNNSSTTKKMMHREIERQRRQEMGTLYSSLRSLLPLEFIKGKRSISDHMNEAVNYIKHLQKKIKELATKREELERLSNLGANASKNENTSNSSPSPIIIRPCLGGFEIVLGSGLGDQSFPLSRVLQVLLEEGISVVNCVSTKVNGRLFCTVQTEVKDPSCLNLPGLQQKLIPLFPSSDISKC